MNNSIDLGNREENQVKRQKEIFDMYKISIFITIVAIIFYYITHYIYAINFVPSTSMEPTLEVGDVLFGTCDTNDIKRYDIIVFNPPLNKDAAKYVKRVIGLPNETIEIKNNKVYANGQLLDDSFINEPMVYEDSIYVIPDDEYFVLGDNRNHSVDARFWKGSFVKKSDIISIEKLIIFPFSRIGNIK